MVPRTVDFEAAIEREFSDAARIGRTYVDIRSGDLHRTVGCYPDARLGRMPSCCNVMYRHLAGAGL